MGMGEPSRSLDNVPRRDPFPRHGGRHHGHKNLVFSAVGDPRAFQRLPEGEVKPL